MSYTEPAPEADELTIPMARPTGRGHGNRSSDMRLRPPSCRCCWTGSGRNAARSRLRGAADAERISDLTAELTFTSRRRHRRP